MKRPMSMPKVKAKFDFDTLRDNNMTKPTFKLPQNCNKSYGKITKTTSK